MVMALSILIKYNDELRYSLVPGNYYNVIGWHYKADKYFERRGISGSYSTTKLKSTLISDQLVSVYGLSRPLLPVLELNLFLLLTNNLLLLLLFISIISSWIPMSAERWHKILMNI